MISSIAQRPPKGASRSWALEQEGFRAIDVLTNPTRTKQTSILQTFISEHRTTWHWAMAWNLPRWVECLLLGNRHKYPRIGTAPSNLDAVAVEASLPALTRNVADFETIPGVRVETY